MKWSVTVRGQQSKEKKTLHSCAWRCLGNVRDGRVRGTAAITALSPRLFSEKQLTLTLL